ncbi:hypothetical protein HMPREF1508_1467 [Shuttleworthella sp. MSX8B]|nr:hypothetical protein HMPREF1508_1467 [Shuttleworthia sp. MSX8B]
MGTAFFVIDFLHEIPGFFTNPAVLFRKILGTDQRFTYAELLGMDSHFAIEDFRISSCFPVLPLSQIQNPSQAPYRAIT